MLKLNATEAKLLQAMGLSRLDQLRFTSTNELWQKLEKGDASQLMTLAYDHGIEIGCYAWRKMIPEGRGMITYKVASGIALAADSYRRMDALWELLAPARRRVLECLRQYLRPS